MSNRIKVILKDGKPVAKTPVQPFIQAGKAIGRWLGLNSGEVNGFDFDAAEERTDNPNYFEITQKGRDHVSLSKDNPAYKQMIAQMSPEERKKYESFVDQKRKEKFFLDKSENYTGAVTEPMIERHKRDLESGRFSSNKEAETAVKDLLNHDLDEKAYGEKLSEKYPRRAGNIVKADNVFEDTWVYSEKLKRYIPVYPDTEEKYNQTKKKK